MVQMRLSTEMDLVVQTRLSIEAGPRGTGEAAYGG
jgi:hypothetical protein